MRNTHPPGAICGDCWSCSGYGRSSQAVLLGDEAEDIWFAKLPEVEKLIGLP